MVDRKSHFAGGEMSTSGTMLETSGVAARFSFAGGELGDGLNGPVPAFFLDFAVICSETGN